jgi:hypothetical protein
MVNIISLFSKSVDIWASSSMEEQGNWKVVGELMYASHMSMSPKIGIQVKDGRGLLLFQNAAGSWRTRPFK